jgi:hypothetical protein
MRIERWFQGVGGCGYQRLRPAAVCEPGALITPHCLYTASSCVEGEDVLRLAAITTRLFGHRCLCPDDNSTPRRISRMVHINNHPETTREDIDKILRVYTEEMEASHD